MRTDEINDKRKEKEEHKIKGRARKTRKPEEKKRPEGENGDKMKKKEGKKTR